MPHCSHFIQSLPYIYMTKKEVPSEEARRRPEGGEGREHRNSLFLRPACISTHKRYNRRNRQSEGADPEGNEYTQIAMKEKQQRGKREMARESRENKNPKEKKAAQLYLETAAKRDIRRHVLCCSLCRERRKDNQQKDRHSGERHGGKSEGAGFGQKQRRALLPPR